MEAAPGRLGHVVPEFEFGHLEAVPLRQPHQRDGADGGLGGGVGRQPDVLGIRVVAVARADRALVVDSAEGEAEGSEVLAVEAAAERLRVDLGARMVVPDPLDRPDRQPRGGFGGVGLEHGARLGRLAGAEAGGARVPEVELEILAGLLRGLEGRRRGGRAVEQEGHDAVVGAVLVALDQSDRQRGPAPAAVAVLAPDPAGADDDVPVGVAGVAERAVGGHQVGAALDQDDVEPRDAAQGGDDRRLLRPQVGVVVDGPGGAAAAEELQRAPHLVARRRGVRRQGEGRVVDGFRELAGQEPGRRQQGPRDVARAGERIAGQFDGGRRGLGGSRADGQEQGGESRHGG